MTLLLLVYTLLRPFSYNAEIVQIWPLDVGGRLDFRSFFHVSDDSGVHSNSINERRNGLFNTK